MMNFHQIDEFSKVISDEFLSQNLLVYSSRAKECFGHDLPEPFIQPHGVQKVSKLPQKSTLLKSDKSKMPYFTVEV